MIFNATAPTIGGGGGDTWTWMGRNPVKVQTVFTQKIYLANTPYATWTPSTTSKVLANYTSLTAITVDMTSYDYILLYKFRAYFEYTTLPSGAYINEQSASLAALGCAVPGTREQIASGTGYTAGGSTTSTLAGGIIYINSSGNEAYSTTFSSAGVYPTSPSLNMARNSITPYTMAVNVKCSSSSFSTTSASKVDQSKSYYEQVIELYRTDYQTGLRAGLGEISRTILIDGI